MDHGYQRPTRSTRRYPMPDGTHQIVTLPDWRWRLLDAVAEHHPGGMDGVMAHHWELCVIRAQREDAAVRSKLLSASIEDALDQWHPSPDEGPRRRPANANHRPNAAARVLRSAPDRWPDLIFPDAAG